MVPMQVACVQSLIRELDPTYHSWRSHTLQSRLKIQHTATKTQSSQIHSWINNFKNKVFNACVHAKSIQSCPTLCNPMDCSLPDSSVRGILQARILEWVAMSSQRGSSQPRDWTHISYITALAGRFFTTIYVYTLFFNILFHYGLSQDMNIVLCAIQ